MKKTFALSALGAALIGVAYAQTVVDFDNQIGASSAPTPGGFLLISGVDTNTSGTNCNVGYFTQDPVNGWIETAPVTATSTGGFPGLGLNKVRVASPIPSSGGFWTTVPAGNATNALEMKFAFIGGGAVQFPTYNTSAANRNVDPAVTRLRATSAVSPGLNKILCPAVDTTLPIAFDIWTEKSLRVCFMFRDQAPQYAGKAIGDSLGTSVPSGLGVIIVGGPTGSPDAVRASGGYGGYVIPAQTWTTVTLDPTSASNYTFRRLALSGPITPGAGTTLVGWEGFMFGPLESELATQQSHLVFVDNMRNVSASRTMSGNLTLPDFQFVSLTSKPVTVEFIQPGTTPTVVGTATVNVNTATSAYTVTVPGSVAPGTYSVRFKSKSFNAKRIDNVDLTGSPTGQNATLVPGDVDNDNVVSILDYIALSSWYELDSSASNWNTFDSGANAAPVDADLDGDGVISILDYITLSSNYEQAGDDLS
jgi:hypothetical protein